MNPLEVSHVPIGDLRFDDKNARKHNARNLSTIKESLTRYGQRKPIVAMPDGTVFAGNGTLEAARELGWTHISVAYCPKDWTMDQARAYALADNRTAELAEWDTDNLSEILGLLKDEDMESLGFAPDELRDLLPDEEKEITEDDAPALPEIPTSKLGDLYQLGNHRLLCADSTLDESLAQLMGDEKADMVWTDPPYGVSYVGKTKDALTIQNDKLNTLDLQAFLTRAFGAIYKFTKAGCCWYVAAPPGNIFQSFSIPLTDLGVWRHTLVWVKNSLVMGRADYHYRHESIFYGWTEGAAHTEPPDRKQDTVWEIDRPSASKEHPTMKPIALIAKAILNSSHEGEIVLDTFGGSGSTLITCEQTNRKCRMIELDPRYVDVIVKRWENFTGRKAQLVTE